MKQISLLLLSTASLLSAQSLADRSSYLQQVLSDRGELRSETSKSGLFWDRIVLPEDTASRDTALTFSVTPIFQSAVSNDTLWFDKNYQVKGGLSAEAGTDRIFARVTAFANSSFKDDSLYLWHKNRKAAARIDEAYGQFNYKYGFLRFGRMNRNWGPFPDRSLLLSANPYSYTAAEWQFAKSWLEFRHLFAALPGYYSAQEKQWKGIEEYQRYIGIHAVNFIPRPNLCFGVSESILFGRKSGYPDFNYINPFIPYAALNGNGEAGGGNVSFEAHFTAALWDSLLTLKGQTLIDDIQIDNESLGDQEPTHWGILTGLYLKEFIPALKLKHSFAVEYSYMSKWIYTVPTGGAVGGERYILGGGSLGLPWIDGDSLTARCTLIHKRFAGTLACAGSRRDTNTIFTHWPVVSGSEVQGYRKETPLSERHSVKRTVTPSLRGFVKLFPWFTAEAGVSLPYESKNRDDGFTNSGIRLDAAVSVTPTFTPKVRQ